MSSDFVRAQIEKSLEILASSAADQQFADARRRGATEVPPQGYAGLVDRLNI
jgi:hypothetical protein